MTHFTGAAKLREIRRQEREAKETLGQNVMALLVTMIIPPAVFLVVIAFTG